MENQVEERRKEEKNEMKEKRGKKIEKGRKEESNRNTPLNTLYTLLYSISINSYKVDTIVTTI